MSTKRDQDKAEAISRLRELVKPGDTIYTTLRHVSRSGMFRLISCHAIVDGEPVYLDGYIARLGHYALDKKRDGLRVSGCGMDMGFAVAYDVSRSLYGQGWECLGERCYAPAHHDRSAPRGAWVMHQDGYALKHRWM